MCDEGKGFGVAVEEEGECVCAFVGDENMPGLNDAGVESVGFYAVEERSRCLQVWVAQLIASHHATPNSQSYASGGEQTPSPSEPAREVGCEIGISSRRQLVGPKVLSTSVWKCTGEFGKGYANAD